MKRKTILTHEFVEYIPNNLADGTIYVSIVFATAAHKCCCGCGNEVITPISPTDWQLTFDGLSISLYPSIGNWSFDCQSHYWIVRNRVRWARRWSREEIETGRAEDQLVKKKYFNTIKAPTLDNTKTRTERSDQGKSEESWWHDSKKTTNAGRL